MTSVILSFIAGAIIVWAIAADHARKAKLLNSLVRAWGEKPSRHDF